MGTAVKRVKVVGARTVPLTIKNVRGARNLTIRVTHEGIVLTKPRWVPMFEAEQFLASREQWIEGQVSKAAKPADVSVLFQGIEHDIRPASCPPVRHTGGAFWSPGSTDLERLEATLTWMRLRSRPILRAAVRRWAKEIGVEPTRFSVRDQVSRWGSCSNSGGISLNWRLVMAPPEVLEYIVIHELSHMRELNHSRRFWAIVAEHCPSYRDHEEWLDKNGERLLTTGRGFALE